MKNECYHFYNFNQESTSISPLSGLITPKQALHAILLHSHFLNFSPTCPLIVPVLCFRRMRLQNWLPLDTHLHSTPASFSLKASHLAYPPAHGHPSSLLVPKWL